MRQDSCRPNQTGLRPGPIADGNKDTIDPRARVGRSRHRPRLWHDGSVGGAARVRPRRLVSRRHARGTYCHGGAQSRPFAGRRRLHGGRESAISGLAAWQGLFQHGRLQAGQSVLAHGAAGAVGSMVTQLAREAGAYVIGTDAPPTVRRRSTSAQTNCRPRERRSERRRWGRSGGDIQRRFATLIRAGGALVSVVGPAEARPADGLAVDFVVEADRAQLGEIVQRVRDGRLRTNIGKVSTLDDALATFNSTERRAGKTVIRIRP